MKIDFAIILFAVIVTASECCVKPCSRMMQKLCAKARNTEDRQTFENPCLLDNYNCQNPSNLYDKISDGDCPAFSAPQPAVNMAPSTVYTVVSLSSSTQSQSTASPSIGPVKFVNNRR